MSIVSLPAGIKIEKGHAFCNKKEGWSPGNTIPHK